jgi:hypothetical protein
MRTPSRTLLVVAALWELFQYDVIVALRGFRGVHRALRRRAAAGPRRPELEAPICRAVESAASVYWKRVRCLQRSAAAARLLRAYGVPAELVIGCTLAPFFSHAWVEVEGRVLNTSPAYAQELHVLERV